MARALRLEFEGAVYHVIVRGNERKAVFRDDVDRRAYLEGLAKCRERFGFRVLAFCLMGTMSISQSNEALRHFPG